MDASSMKASTCDLIAMGDRLRAAREALNLSRPAFKEKFGGSVRTLENNEAGRNEPGACLVAIYAENGINANWLLTGDGPMLLSDLAKAAQPPQVTINAQFLAAMLRGILQEGTPLEKACEGAVQFYMHAIETGMITADGKVGSGGAKAA